MPTPNAIQVPCPSCHQVLFEVIPPYTPNESTTLSIPKPVGMKCPHCEHTVEQGE